jgi:hypothetical protein
MEGIKKIILGAVSVGILLFTNAGLGLLFNIDNDLSLPQIDSVDNSTNSDFYIPLSYDQTPEFVTATDEVQQQETQIPDVNELIQKPIDDLVAIYQFYEKYGYSITYGSLEPQEKEIVDKWITNYVDKWYAEEKVKKEELAIRIHLKPIAKELNIAEERIDKEVEKFSDLIIGGLEEKKGIYELNEFEEIYNVLKTGSFEKRIGMEIINSKTFHGFDSATIDKEKEIINGKITSITAAKDDDLIIAGFMEKPIDLSGMEQISFDFNLDIKSNEDVIPKIKIKLIDSNGNSTEAIKEIGNEVNVEECEIRQGLREIKVYHIVGEGNLIFKKDDFKEGIQGKKMDLANIKEIDFILYYPKEANLNEGNVTISNFNIKTSQALGFKLSTKKIKEFLETAMSVRKWTPKDAWFINELSKEPGGFERFAVIYPYFNEEDNWLKTFGVLGALVLKTHDLKAQEINKDVLQNIFEEFKEGFSKWFPFLNSSEYKEIESGIKKYYYPSFVKIRNRKTFKDKLLEVILNKEKILQEIDKLSKDKSLSNFLKLKTILESALFKRLNLNNSVTDRMMIWYWSNFIKNNHSDIEKFNRFVKKEGKQYFPYYGYETLASFNWREDFLPALPSDILFGVKQITTANLSGKFGMYIPEFQTVVLKNIRNTSMEVSFETFAHEFSHHLDWNILKEYEYYDSKSGKYADISNLFYKVYGEMTKPEKRWGIGRIGESLAYYFGRYANESSYKRKYAREKMQEGNFGLAILELITTYLLAFDKGYGLAYGYNPDNLPLTFSEVRVKLQEAEEKGMKIPEIFKEALDATELIFYKWRNDAGYKSKDRILEKYQDLSSPELRERIKKDFPNFYPEIIAFAINGIKTEKGKNINLTDKLQSLRQMEFEINRSSSFLPLIWNLLDGDIPVQFKLLLLGKLSERLKNYLFQEREFESVLGSMNYGEEILNKFFNYLRNEREDKLIKAGICSFLLDLLNKDWLTEERRNEISKELENIVVNDDWLRETYNSMKQRKGNFAKEILRRLDLNEESLTDRLNVYKNPQILIAKSKQFLERIKDLNKDEILTLLGRDKIDPETLATEIVEKFWNSLSHDELLDEIIKNNWNCFLWDLGIMVERSSWRIYKEIIDKFGAKSEISLPSLPEKSIIINPRNLSMQERQMKELLEELKEGGEFYYPEEYGFDDRWNENGKEFGSWNAFPKDYTQYCKDSYSDISLGAIGSSLRLDYDVESENPQGAYNGFWMKIPKKDLTQYQALVLFVKGDEVAGYPKRIKISLEDKEWVKTDIPPSYGKEILKGRADIYIEGINEDWQIVIIPLKEFLKSSNLENLKSIDTLSITFEKDKLGRNIGSLFIDEIGFIKNTSLLENYKN